MEFKEQTETEAVAYRREVTDRNDVSWVFSATSGRGGGRLLRHPGFLSRLIDSPRGEQIVKSPAKCHLPSKLCPYDDFRVFSPVEYRVQVSPEKYLIFVINRSRDK